MVDPKILTRRHNEAWEEIKNGHFEEGLKSLYDVVSEEGTGRYLGSRGIANLLVGKCREAVDDLVESRKAIRVFTFVGCSLWICGDREAACEDWSREMGATEHDKLMYTDAVGYVHPAALLWWASAHLDLHSWRGAAEQQLSALLNTDTSLQNGLGLIIPFLMSEINEEELIVTSMNQKYKVVESIQLCRAHFYIAAMHLKNGDIGAYRRELLNVLGYGPNYSMPEHHLARYELTVLPDST